MSTDLIQQLKACSVKLGEQAEQLQQLIQKGRNKNKHYKDVMEEARVFERLNLLKISWEPYILGLYVAYPRCMASSPKLAPNPFGLKTLV